MLLETDNLILKKAEFEDWKSMYRNVWSRSETAKYMAWRVATNEEDAIVRMQKTIKYQENHDAYFVYEKESGQAIGFAYRYAEKKTDLRNGTRYELEVYHKEI